MFEITDSDLNRVYKFTENFERSEFHKIEQHINDFYLNDSRDLVFDFENLPCLDSQSLSILIRMKNKLSSQQRDIELVNYNENIERVLNMSGISAFLLK